MASKNFAVFQWYNEHELHDRLRDFSRLRDYHSFKRGAGANDAAWGIFGIIAKLAADSINATLITRAHRRYKRNTFPLFKPLEGENLVYEGWKKYYHKGASGPSSEPMMHVMSPLNWNINFIYCGSKAITHDSIWDSSYLLESFSLRMWLAILLSTICIALLAFRAYQIKALFSIYQLNLLASLSVLLTPGFTKPHHVAYKYSKLFVMWMLSSLIIATYYTGDMTSKVITPPPEVTITDLPGIRDKRYSLQYTSDIKGMLHYNLGTLHGFPIYVNPNFKLIKKLLKGDLVERGHIGNSPQEFLKFVLMMLEKEDSATLMWWQAALNLASEINDFVSKRGASSNVTISSCHWNKKCHIGKHLISTGLSFFGFVPPGSVRLAHGLQIVIEFGIVARWIREHYELHYAERAQDRVRFVAPTKLPKDEDRNVIKLAIQGKIAAIFVLWGAGCFVCAICLFLEFFNKFCLPENFICY